MEASKNGRQVVLNANLTCRAEQVATEKSRSDQKAIRIQEQLLWDPLVDESKENNKTFNHYSDLNIPIRRTLYNIHDSRSDGPNAILHCPACFITQQKIWLFTTEQKLDNHLKLQHPLFCSLDAKAEMKRIITEVGNKQGMKPLRTCSPATTLEKWSTTGKVESSHNSDGIDEMNNASKIIKMSNKKDHKNSTLIPSCDRLGNYMDPKIPFDKPKAEESPWPSDYEFNSDDEVPPPSPEGSSQEERLNELDNKRGGQKYQDMYCWVCHKDRVEKFCNACPRSYHFKCSNSSSWTTSKAKTICPQCTVIMESSHENFETRPETMKTITVSELNSMLKFACQRMKTTPGAKDFLNLIDNGPQTYEYFKCAVHPMDLTTLDANCGQYKSTEEFLASCRWLVHNSVIFNSATSRLTAIAKRILKVCQQEIQDIETCPECYVNANRNIGDWFIKPCKRPHVLVWAKLKTFPFWPAKAMTINNEMVDVRFFGSHDRGRVPGNDCFLYSKKGPTLATTRSEKNPDLLAAKEELNVHVENLKDSYGPLVFAAPRTPLGSQLSLEAIQKMLPEYNKRPEPSTSTTTTTTTPHTSTDCQETKKTPIKIRISLKDPRNPTIVVDSSVPSEICVESKFVSDEVGDKARPSSPPPYKRLKTSHASDSEIEDDDEEEIQFKDFGLCRGLLMAIRDIGWEKPSPAQKASIPIAISGQDILAVVPPGTGKSGAYLIPLLERVDPTLNAIQSVIVVPTKHLVLHVSQVCTDLAKHLNLKVSSSGTIKLGEVTQVVIATPDEIVGFLEKNASKMDQCDILVLVDIDKLLTQFPCECLENITSFLPPKRQILIYSSTFEMINTVESLMSKLAMDPYSINLMDEPTPSAPAPHPVVFFRPWEKSPTGRKSTESSKQVTMDFDEQRKYSKLLEHTDASTPRCFTDLDDALSSTKIEDNYNARELCNDELGIPASRSSSYQDKSKAIGGIQVRKSHVVSTAVLDYQPQMKLSDVEIITLDVDSTETTPTMKNKSGITRRDLETLAPSKWMNDNIINYYMELISLRSRQHKESPKVHAFSTFFYKKLVQEKYSAQLRRWTRKVDIFEFDILLFPIHLGINWCLACADLRNKTVRFYDPVGCRYDKCLEKLVEYLGWELKERKNKILNPEEWLLEENVKDVPQQQNGSDCGLFTCKFAEYISRDAPLTFGQEEMKCFRNKLIHEIISQELLYP